MSSKVVSFYISSEIGLHTAVPYILELEKREIEVILYVSDDISWQNLKDYGIKSSYSYISNLRKFPINEFIHRVLILLFTPIDYSPNFDRWLKQRLNKRNYFLQRILHLFRIFSTMIKIDNLNNLIFRVLSPITPSLLNSEKIVAITLPVNSHLLCSKHFDVFTILESWDQIYRSPVGYKSKKVFLWNKSLSNDWIRIQGDAKTYETYPVKLKYAHNQHVKDSKVIRRILYAPMTSSSSYKKMYIEETKFIELLCKITKKLKLDLFIKPKPNTQKGDLDLFLKYKNVSIGCYQDNDSGSSYSLSKEYNNNRRSEINSCDLLINIGTTFCLDCAFYGLPILQIKLNLSSYPVISNLGSHTTQYINSKEDFIFTLDDNENLDESLFSILTSRTTLDHAKALRDSLREWLIPGESMNESVLRVIDEILEED